MTFNDEVCACAPNGLFSEQALKMCLKKVALIVFFASLIGILDDLQVRYLRLENFGSGTEIAYQFCFLAASGGAAYCALYTKSWSNVRNLSNFLMILPIAAIADNVSIDAGTLRPYLILIPKQGYVWRQTVFGQTVALSYVANWVNQQSIAPSLINGYVASIVLAAIYVMMQFAWIRRDGLGNRDRRNL
jgi:hypothetical protein